MSATLQRLMREAIKDNPEVNPFLCDPFTAFLPPQTFNNRLFLSRTSLMNTSVLTTEEVARKRLRLVCGLLFS